MNCDEDSLGFGGSSPHARGAPGHTFEGLTNPRIIPACAGSTSAAQAAFNKGMDHPRMRGEHIMFAQNKIGSMGSSPHARGARHLRDQVRPRRGIIPACAGSTLEDQRQSLVYAYDSLTFARMQFDRRITESRKSRSAFLRTASPFGTCSHRSTPSKGDPQGWRHRFRWAEV